MQEQKSDCVEQVVPFEETLVDEVAALLRRELNIRKEMIQRLDLLSFASDFLIQHRFSSQSI